MLGPPSTAVAEPDLDASHLVQVAKVALGCGPAYPGHLGYLRGGHLLAAGCEQPLDGIKRVGRPARRD